MQSPTAERDAGQAGQGKQRRALPLTVASAQDVPAPVLHPKASRGHLLASLLRITTRTDPLLPHPCPGQCVVQWSCVHNPFIQQMLFKGMMGADARKPRSNRSCSYSSRSGQPETTAGRMWSSCCVVTTVPRPVQTQHSRGRRPPQVTGVARNTHKTPAIKYKQ